MSNKERPKTKYEEFSAKSAYGKPLFDKQLRYCVRCCMPETAEGLAFDEMGICQPCRSAEQKIHINWVEREKRLNELLQKYRSKDGKNYDCIIPISGGKDSTFQLYVLTQIYKMKPLAVTFSHNWFSDTGKYNLQNSLEVFDVDHIMFTPRRSVINKLAKKSLPMIGDSCWHCHAGVGAFPLQIAVKYNVKLLIWGESVSENDGRATYKEPIIYDRDYFTKISARYEAEEMVDQDISLLDVCPYVLPAREEVEKTGIVGIHLGDYIFWDDERQTEFVRDNFGWKEDKVEGTYKRYKSVECKMAGVHDYSKFIKRGFGRGTDHASLDVRAGLLTKYEGFELAKKYDTERPDALDEYLKITGYTEDEFENILKTKREDKAKGLI
jgi:N-acetyl sugar amidotransferase